MGVYKKSSFGKATIFDPATYDKAQMNTLIAGDTFLAPEESVDQQTPDGSYQSATRYRVQFASSDMDAYHQINSWAESKTPVQAVAASSVKNGANLQWYESVAVKIKRHPKQRIADGDAYFVAEMEYVGGLDAAIFNNINLLHQRNVNGVTVTGFIDADADGLVDGAVYTSGVGAAPTFENGVQSLTSTATSVGLGFDVVFPIATKVIGGTYYTDVHIDSVCAVVLKALDMSNITLNTYINSGINVIGNHSVVGDQSNDLVYLYELSFIRVIGPSQADQFSAKDAFLRTDGVSEYISG